MCASYSSVVEYFSGRSAHNLGIFRLISKRMNYVRTELFKRQKDGWVLRTVLNAPPNPRVVEWLKSPFGQNLLNKSVER
mgnify:CR=1 FL=1